MMDFDTTKWRAARDQKYREWVGDPAAISYLLAIGDFSEFFDDLFDRDVPVTNDRIAKMLKLTVVDFPQNPFFITFKQQLLPLHTMVVSAWLDANDLERGSDMDKSRAYVLRDLAIELVLYVVQIVRGYSRMRELSLEIRRFFLHETLQEYTDDLAKKQGASDDHR